MDNFELINNQIIKEDEIKTSSVRLPDRGRTWVIDPNASESLSTRINQSEDSKRKTIAGIFMKILPTRR